MNEVSDIVLFFGRFHPLVVHLPIGFLFFAFILEVFARWKGNKTITSAVPLALLLGSISALVACILGYMLSLSGDYEEGALDTHFWFGVATTLISFLAWLVSAEKLKIPVIRQGKPYMATLSLIVILLSVTGHYGGNLTHGADYLTAYLPFGQEKEELVAVNSVEEAQIFNHLVKPILAEKCMSCHNASKKKGQLSFADSESILKGGKNGPVFMMGDASKSEMILRVLLDPHDKKFMPPEGKTPLTKEEITILEYWIEKGEGKFDTTVGATETSDLIKKEASKILGLDPETIANKKISALPAPSRESINILIDRGFKVRELVASSNMFDIILPSGSNTKDQNNLTEQLKLLKPLKKNVIWLSLGDNNITDKELLVFEGFENLKLLKLDRNPITDKGISSLPELRSLEALNLFGTQITKSSLNDLDKFPKLKKVYVWNTNITKEDLKEYHANNDSDIKVNL